MAIRGGVEYSEAIAAAKARGVVLPQEYYGLLQKEMRSRAFSVARISNINRIQDILQSLEQATQRGDSLGRWQKQMREGGLDKLFINRAHAETVYINALQTHYSIGRWAQFQDNKERRPYLMYDAVNDSRTRPAHRKLDGFIARIDDPVWSTIYPPNGHRCILPNQKISGDFEIGLKSFYSGKAVKITAKSGNSVSLTVNHPVLTSRGWVKAGDVTKLDYLICDKRREGFNGLDAGSLGVNTDDGHARIEDVFYSLSLQALGFCNGSGFDFNGDRKSGDEYIYVVGPNAPLMNCNNSFFSKLFNDWFLGSADGIIEFSNFGRFENTIGAALTLILLRDADATIDNDFYNKALANAKAFCNITTGKPFIDKEGENLLFGLFKKGALSCNLPSLAALPLDQLSILFDFNPLYGFGLGLSSWPDIVFNYDASDYATGNSKVFSDTVFANAGKVFADNVVSVDVFDFSGHVYDFQTKSGIMFAEGFIVHNCRCGTIALTEKQAALRGGPTGEIPPGAGADPGWEYNPATQHDDVLQNILDGYAKNLPPSMQDIARHPMPTISPESLDVRGINKALREWQRTEPAMTEPVRIGAVSPQLESALASQGEPLSLPKEQAIIELYQEAVRANAKAGDGLINEPLAEIITLANYGDFAGAFGLAVSHQELVQSGLTLQAGRIKRIAQSFGIERDAMAAWASEAILYNTGDAATTLATRLAGETGRDVSVFLDLFDALDADDFGALLLSKVMQNG
ncbi:MAG: minor capsid protein [Burkholderiales bacterium]|nr:minor capsid protein [Burkholderiales bacterium]